MDQPILRAGRWWHRREDGSWLLWDESQRAWNQAPAAPPPPPPPPVLARPSEPTPASSSPRWRQPRVVAIAAFGTVVLAATVVALWPKSSPVLAGGRDAATARIDGTWRATHVVVETSLVGPGFDEVGDSVSADWIIQHRCESGPCDVSVERVQGDGRVIGQTMEYGDGGYSYELPERLGPDDAVCVVNGVTYSSDLIEETRHGRLQVTKYEIRDGMRVATELRGWRTLTGAHTGAAANAGCLDWKIEDEGVLVRID